MSSTWGDLDRRWHRLIAGLPPETGPFPWPEFDALSDDLQCMICGDCNAFACVELEVDGGDTDEAIVQVMLDLTALAQRDSESALAQAREVMAEAHRRCS